MLLRRVHLLHRRWGVLAEDVRFVCRDDRSGRRGFPGDDLGHLHLRPCQVHAGHRGHDGVQTRVVLADNLALLGSGDNAGYPGVVFGVYDR